jgi:hypothetical protein
VGFRMISLRAALVVVAAGGANAIGAFGRGSTGMVGYADVRC